MRIMVDVEEAAAIAPLIWTAAVSPENVRKLSSPLSSTGMISILLVEEARYETGANRLSFPFGSVRVLNLGTTNQAVFVSAVESASEHVPQADGSAPSSDAQNANEVRLGFGDRDCIRAFSRMPVELMEVGRRLVETIRGIDPNGDFKQEGHRFVNRPDNWVTLQAQPRVREILVTFKGSVETNLKTASARRPYQGVKVRSAEDLQEVARIFAAAKRRSG